MDLRGSLTGLALCACVAVASLAPRPAAAACDVRLTDFGSALSTTREAIKARQHAAAREVIDTFHQDIGCLEFVPPRRMWAEWLFLVALTEWFEDRGSDAWQGPLQQAWELDPDAGRGLLGSRHAFYRWEVPEEEPPLEALNPVRPGYATYVDGTPATSLRRTGIHLVQLRNGARWDSALVRPGEPLPDLAVPRSQPSPVDVSLEVTLHGGAGNHRWFDDEGTWGETTQLGVSRTGGSLRGQVDWRGISFRGDILFSDATMPDWIVVGRDGASVGGGIGVGRVSGTPWVPWGNRRHGSTPASSSEPLDTPSVDAIQPVVAGWWRSGGIRSLAAEVMLCPSWATLRASVFPQRARDPLVRVRLGVRGGVHRLRLRGARASLTGDDSRLDLVTGEVLSERWELIRFGGVGLLEVGFTVRDGALRRSSRAKEGR